MSHIADCDIEIRDFKAVEAAAKALGGEYLPNETKIRYYGRFLDDWKDNRAARNRFDPSRFGQTDAGVIRFKDSGYDVGFLKNDDGSYTPYYDTWGSEGAKISQKLGGMQLPKLKDEYAAAVAIRAAARKGFRVVRSTGPKGEIILKARA